MKFDARGPHSVLPRSGERTSYSAQVLDEPLAGVSDRTTPEFLEFTEPTDTLTAFPRLHFPPNALFYT